MSKLLDLVPWWVDALLISLVAGGLGLVVYGYGRHQREAGRQEVRARWNAEKVEQQQASLKAQATTAAETQRRISAMQEIVNDATTQKNAALADAADARTERDRLRQQQARFLAAIHASRPASDPATSTGSPSAASAADLFSDLFGESDEGSGILAAALDSARAAGLACERAYDALTQH